MADEPSPGDIGFDIDLQAQVGANLRRIREGKGLTQEQLAHVAGLATRHLQKIEAGEVNLTLRTIERLRQALNVEASVLLERPRPCTEDRG